MYLLPAEITVLILPLPPDAGGLAGAVPPEGLESELGPELALGLEDTC